MNASVIYVGLDVHKDSIVIAIARPGREPAENWKTLPNDGAKLRKSLKSLTKNGEVLRVCYEAGKKKDLALRFYLAVRSLLQELERPHPTEPAKFKEVAPAAPGDSTQVAN